MTTTDSPGGDSGDGWPTESTAVVADGLARWFGDVTVLEDVSFALEAGTTTAMVGPNGSGKTTLLRILAGTLPASSGSVRTRGGDGRTVGYLPQDPAFRPVFTVAETLDLYAGLLDEEVDRQAALDRVGLGGVADRRVGALSGGMVRLVGIAVAALGDPPLLLLDEPTSDLDPRMADHVFEVVADIAADGTAVLLATHDVVGATRMDEVLLLDRGGVVTKAPPSDLVADAGADSLADAFRTLVGGETELTVRAGQRMGESAGDGVESAGDGVESAGSGGEE